MALKATFEEIQSRAIADWDNLCGKTRILVGAATCGRSAGALSVLDTINEELVNHNINAVVTQVGCIGLCYIEPIISIVKPGQPHIFYASVTPELIPQIIEDYLLKGDPRPDLALGTVGDKSVNGIPKLFDLPIFKPQVRNVLRNCGFIDPTNIYHYIANGGYGGLVKALQMMPEDVIEEVRKSGLRGRGGAGFPTGVKWGFCRKAPGQEKYLICNADEGDPGAFMNRSVLEGDPHAVLEGMLIGAYAIGATKGYVYCRAEYPLALERLYTALNQMKEYGVLGDNILGTDFSFDIEIKEGAGAFVCGEETALIASIEGKRGISSSRPPFPATSGIWGRPTNINNVETWTDVSMILQRGAAWFASYGAENSKGTKTFSLAGKVKRNGLIEVPLGTPLRQVIYDIGGGIAGDKRFKAVQTGGPSGGFIPAELLETPVDYESLTKLGSIMGSGGMVVTDEDNCVVDMARFFLTFTQSESCGKCAPCRVGTRQMLDILERICRGEGKEEDIDKLQRLAETVRDSSLCALGRTAPNPVLTSIRYFRDEYEAHIKGKKCPAAVCKGLVKAPCSHICPAGVDVPRFLRFIHRGKSDEALAVLKEKLPFAETLGYVCPAFCEGKCRRGLVDKAVATRVLHRLAAETGDELWKTKVKIAPATGKRIAIIGAGPAGLTASYYLAKQGHTITVFEALPEPGGMLRYGIPEYRLPRAVIAGEIEEIKSFGVDIRTNAKVSSVDDLFTQGYDAIFLAIGAHQGVKLGVEGEDSTGVMEGVSWLKSINMGDKVRVGDKVAVIGGGSTAIDVSRTALRLGAKEAMVIYRRTKAEMPAGIEEIEDAIQEGVKIELLTAPAKIERKNAKVELTCIRMELGAVDASGRRRPVPIEGSEFSSSFDTVIVAIGQRPEAPEQFGLALRKGNRFQADPYTLAMDRKGVFAGGDAMTGAATVVEAIAAGRQAAISIDKYLGGDGVVDEILSTPDEEVALSEIDEEKHRLTVPTLPLHERLHSFAEVELEISEETAIGEARRCLLCDLEKSI